MKNFLSNPRVNKRVSGATKVKVNGITFDSKLEFHMYSALKNRSIQFDFKPKFVLLDGFTFNNQTVRPITHKPDFYFSDLKLFVDTKGFKTDKYAIIEKLFKRALVDQGFGDHSLIFLETKKDVDNFIFKLLWEKQNKKPKKATSGISPTKTTG